MRGAQRKPDRIVASLVGLAVLFALASVALAQVSANYDLSWHTIAGGGGRMESTSHTLLGTAGQPLAGPISGSGHALSGGFWHGDSGETPQSYRVCLPLVMRGQP